jgi:mannosyltransferase
VSPALPGWRYATASIAILLLAGALRLPGLSRPAWLDETQSFTRAADPTLFRMARNSLSSQHPPLYYAVLRAWIAVFGPSDLAARLLSLVLTIGSLVVLLATLGMRSPPAGLPVGILFATNPLLVRYGTEIRSYALLVLFVLVAAAAAWRLAEAPATRSARAVLLIAVPSAVLTHVTGVFLLPAIVALVAVAANRAERKRALLAIAAPIAAGAAVFVAVAAGLEALGAIKRNWWIPTTTAGLVVRSFGSLVGLPGRSAEGHASHLLLGAVILATAAALVIVSRERMAIAFLSAAGAFWASIVLTSVFLVPILLDRILLPALPLFFSAVALAAFSRRRAERLAAAAAVLAIAFLWANDVRASFGRPIEDFREAAIRIGGAYRTGDAIFVLPGFAATSLQRYLPGEAARAVRGIPSPEALSAILADAARANDGADVTAPTWYLLVRPGMDFRWLGNTFARLVEAIASRARRPQIRILLIEPIDSPMAPESDRYRNETVSAARKALGEPDEESTNGLLYDARWHAEPAGR